jgi:acetolactate synthase-1/2/3 large subunit
MIDSPSNVDGIATVSDFLAQWLVSREVSHVFTLPGGMIASVLDAVHRNGTPELVTLHHEQAVAFAVDGAGRFHGTPAVGLVTAGPGATNMLTAVASAYLDSVPALFLTGQVQSYLRKGDRSVRQFGFQECDIIAMSAPVTKAAWRATSGDQVPAMLDAAMDLAVTGRPGPVLIELPSDVQTMPVPEGTRPAGRSPRTVAPFTDDAFIDDLFTAVAAAQRPLVLIGGGVRAADAAADTRDLLLRLGAPVAASVMALDVLAAGDPLRIGMVGMYGNRWVNHAVCEADVVLVLGSRLDFGTIGADASGWGRARTVFQVDCDPGEMRRVRRVRSAVGDLGAFVAAALPKARLVPDWAPWWARIAALRKQFPDIEELAHCEGVNPNVLVRQLSASSSAAAAFVIDAGQHLWWACQSIQPRAHQRFMPALGLGPCGWALPAAIGVAHTTGRPVVVVAGDGAFQLNIQELQSVVRGRLPIKIVILDNGAHGSVRQLQEQAFGGRYPATVLGYDAPDFARVAQAYGIDSRYVSAPDAVDEAMHWLWTDPMAPALLHVGISATLNVYPNVPFGASISTMESGRR